MADISGFGVVITILASKTLKIPVPVMNLPKDTDPVGISENVIGDAETGVNGEIISWSTNNPLEFSLAMIPNSIADQVLYNIAKANRPTLGQRPAGDVITISMIYPDGSTLNFTGGKMTSFTPAPGIGGDGKLKTPEYKFKFQDSTRTPAILP